MADGSTTIDPKCAGDAAAAGLPADGGQHSQVDPVTGLPITADPSLDPAAGSGDPGLSTTTPIDPATGMPATDLQATTPPPATDPTLEQAAGF